MTQLNNGSWVWIRFGRAPVERETMSWSSLGTGLPLTPVVDIQEDVILNRLVVSTYGRGVWACPLPNAPALAGAVTDIVAPRTQCMGLLTGQPRIHFSGTQALNGVHFAVEAAQGNVLIQDTVWTGFDSPLVHGDEVLLNAFHLAVPNAGAWEIAVHAWSPEQGVLGAPFSATVVASGLGHTSTLTWWGDCENVDMRWELRDATSQDVVLQSVPLSAADTVSQNWCLSEGCYELVWNDQGGDGFSGAYCGEPGGYALTGPFEDIISDAQGLDFGEELTVPFCVSGSMVLAISMGMAREVWMTCSPCSPTLDAKALLSRHRPRRQRGCGRFDEHAVRLWTGLQHRLKRSVSWLSTAFVEKYSLSCAWPCVASKRHAPWPQLNALGS